MNQKVISGIEIQETILEELKLEVSKLKESNITPKLIFILVGDDKFSKNYIKLKIKACKKIGIDFDFKQFENEINQSNFEKEILNLNKDPKVHGIMIQTPLPDQLDEDEIMMIIDPKKDVDCFHPENIGLLAIGRPRSLPVTPYGIYQIIRRSGKNIEGKNVVIIGRGNTVGRPLSLLMSLKGMDATVTLTHSKTENLKDLCQQADIIVAAFGSPKFITSDFVKKDAVVIDVGINRIKNEDTGKFELVGDTDFDNLLETVSKITPVKGGVGPITVAMLMYNTIACTKDQVDIEVSWPEFDQYLDL